MIADSAMPRLEHAANRAQKRFSAKPFLTVDLPNGESWSEFYRFGHDYLVRFIGLADFVISKSGKKVTVNAEPGVTGQTIQHLFHNQALPLALSLQKKLVLHGSAVEIDNRCIVFLGESGRGKSTLAASFSSNGYRFLTDDGLLIDKSASGYIVRPSHPSIRLWGDSHRAVVEGAATSEPAIDYNSKVRFLAGEQLPFCAENRSLGHIYFLGDGSAKELEISAVKGQRCVNQLLKTCFLLGIDEKEMLAFNFQQLAELSRLPSFFMLDFPRKYDVLDQVRAAIVTHFYDCQ